MITLAMFCIIGAIIGIGIGGLIAAHSQPKTVVRTQFPTPVKMPDGSTRYMVGGGELLLPDLKDRIK